MQVKELTNIPWILLNDELEGEIASGGIVVQAKAGAALAIGDVVWVSAAGTVNKSIVAADHIKRAGVVIGGRKFDRSAVQRKNDVGLQAAAINEPVYVCVAGLCYCVAAAAIAAGLAVKPDVVTAGRVMAAVLGAGADEGKVIGQTWEVAAAAGDKILVLITRY